MKTFIYYIKLDSTREAINKVSAEDFDDAILIASQIKQLSIEEFSKLFSIEEI